MFGGLAIFLYFCKSFLNMRRFTDIYKKLYIWRLHHISEQNYLLLLSVVVGVLSGLAAVALKTVVHLSGRHPAYCAVCEVCDKGRHRARNPFGAALYLAP